HQHGPSRTPGADPQLTEQTRLANSGVTADNDSSRHRVAPDAGGCRQVVDLTSATDQWCLRLRCGHVLHHGWRPCQCASATRPLPGVLGRTALWLSRFEPPQERRSSSRRYSTSLFRYGRWVVNISCSDHVSMGSW